MDGRVPPDSAAPVNVQRVTDGTSNEARRTFESRRWLSKKSRHNEKHAPQVILQKYTAYFAGKVSGKAVTGTQFFKLDPAALVVSTWIVTF